MSRQYSWLTCSSSELRAKLAIAQSATIGPQSLGTATSPRNTLISNERNVNGVEF